MSYASLTKSFPDFIKSCSETLFQPTGIAVMASVGVHVLLGAALPYMSLSSQEKPKPRRTVQLVQLSPTEQGRLPQLSPSPLPPLPNQFPSLSNQLPPLSPLPSSLSSPFPPLNFKNSTVGKLPSISPLPPFGSVSLPPIAPFPRQRSIPSLAQSFGQQQTRLQMPIRNSPRLQNLPSRPSILNNPDLSGLTGGLKPSPLPPVAVNPSQNTESSEPNQTPKPLDPPNPLAPPRQIPNSSIPNSSESSTPTSPVAANPGLTQPPFPSAPGTSTPGSSPAPSIIPPPQQQVVADISQIRQSIKADNRNTTPDEARRNDVAWRAQMQQNVKEKELSLTGTYPKAACLKQLKGTAIYNVLVDGNGKSTNLDLIRSAGYPIFNDQARQQINSHSFEKAGEPRFYQVSVNFEYNQKICPSLKVPQNTEKPQEADRPQNSAKPQESDRPQNSAKPQNSTETSDQNSTEKPRPTSTETSARNFVEKLRRDLPETPRQNSTEPSGQNSTEKTD